jgi:hypothetical protein
MRDNPVVAYGRSNHSSAPACLGRPYPDDGPLVASEGFSRRDDLWMLWREQTREHCEQEIQSVYEPSIDRLEIVHWK